ncbi:Hsp20/alpha crystallin family protein [Bacillus sp. B1-b2]|uniref:Hsp20/alpha crystallin family protein n=1 Tax=Bacillus sp. B1-b2 TaxID=2653201 RepID=UPI0012621675|nr:Hsp20/alpha crystallin family protein [Bacillus sp. B1-b2]KAB7673044.1 Hsp20/alpha crystallin family protein [Bacillus sp. B1-b2]
MFPWNLFPFNKESKGKLDQMKPQDIQKYVQDMMDKMMPESLQNQTMNPESMFKNFSQARNMNNENVTKEEKFHYMVFETHHHVFVRIPIKDPVWLDQIKIFYTSNQIIIQHIPNMEDKQTITLPAVVKRKGSAAVYKDDILEIRIQKNSDIQYSEIDVTEMH